MGTQRRRGYLLLQLGQWHRIYSTSFVWVVENPQVCSLFLHPSHMAIEEQVWGSCLGPKWSAAACSQVASPPPAPTDDTKGGSSSSTRTHPARGTQQGHVWLYDQQTHSRMECLGSTLQISFFFLNFYRNTVDLQYCFRCTTKWSSFMYKWYIFFFMFSSILCYYWRRKWQPSPVFLPGKS